MNAALYSYPYDAVRFGQIVQPQWEYPADQARYPEAVITGYIAPTHNFQDLRFHVALLPAIPGDYAMEWRLYLSEVTVTERTMTLDEVTAIMEQIRTRYASRHF